MTPSAASDLVSLVQLLPGLIADSESLRAMLDFSRGLAVGARDPETPGPSTAIGMAARRGKPPGGSAVSALLTTEEAAAYLRVSERTVKRLHKRKCFKRTEIAGTTRWRRSELDRYIEMRTRGAR